MGFDLSVLPIPILIAAAYIALPLLLLNKMHETWSLLRGKDSIHALISELQTSAEISKQLGESGHSEAKTVIDTYIDKVVNEQLKRQVRTRQLRLYRSFMGALLDFSYQIAVPLQVILQTAWIYWIYSDRPYGFQAVRGIQLADWSQLLVTIFGMTAIGILGWLIVRLEYWAIERRIGHADFELADGAINNGSLPGSRTG